MNAIASARGKLDLEHMWGLYGSKRGIWLVWLSSMSALVVCEFASASPANTMWKPHLQN